MIAVFAITAYDKEKLATHPGIDVGSDTISCFLGCVNKK
jgi:hypothetical protein